MNLTPIGGGRGTLDTPAARSLARVDIAVLAVIGRVLQISEAARTNAKQWEYWNAYFVWSGGRWVVRPASQRPSWLGRPAWPTTSPHEAGNAFDTNDWVSPLIYAILREHGWRCWSQAEPNYPAKGEPWHWVYYASLDNHRTVPMTQGADGVWRIAIPIAPEPIRPPEEDHMLAVEIKDEKGLTHKAIIGPKSLRHLIATDDPDYIRNVVRAEDDWVETTVAKLPVLLRTYGCDLEIFRIVDNGQGGTTMQVLDPLDGQYKEGAVWTAENVIRAQLAKLGS